MLAVAKGQQDYIPGSNELYSPATLTKSATAIRLMTRVFGRVPDLISASPFVYGLADGLVRQVRR